MSQKLAECFLCSSRRPRKKLVNSYSYRLSICRLRCKDERCSIRSTRIKSSAFWRWWYNIPSKNVDGAVTIYKDIQ